MKPSITLSQVKLAADTLRQWIDGADSTLDSLLPADKATFDKIKGVADTVDADLDALFAALGA